MLDMTSTAESVGRSAFHNFFSPASVAVIGATDREGSVGRTILTNLLNGLYKGKVYAVNPSRAEVLGVKCFARVGALPKKVDLAVVVTPAAAVPGVIRECVEAGVRSAIVITAGFKEKGPEGAELERQIQAELRRGTMRLVGPNCLGMMNPRLGLNATFARDIARPGNVAFLSQSGALLTAILDWSDARAFLSAAREVGLSKPIIVIKAGRSEAAAKAATSNTGALVGSDEVFDAAFRRCGVLRVQNISDLFFTAEVLGKQPRPRGPRLTILTNAGGPGVLATDALMATGGELAPLSGKSHEQLSQFLPSHWSHNNPIDILGDADPERYARALEIAIADPNTDGLLVILAPQGMTEPAQVAERLKPFAKGRGIPVLASWMGGKGVAEGTAVVFRPIRPEDEPLVAKFHETLSERAVYLRYFHMEKLSTRVAHERLLRKCFIDYERKMVLVAEFTNPQTGEREILGVGRLTKENHSRAGEVGVLVTDRCQQQGLGTALLRKLIEVACAEKYERITAIILPENVAMRALAAHCGFRVEPTSDPTMVTAVLKL